MLFVLRIVEWVVLVLRRYLLMCAGVVLLVGGPVAVFLIIALPILTETLSQKFFSILFAGVTCPVVGILTLRHLPEVTTNPWLDVLVQGVLGIQRRLKVRADGIVGQQTVRAASRQAVAKRKGSSLWDRLRWARQLADNVGQTREPSPDPRLVTPEEHERERHAQWHTLVTLFNTGTITKEEFLRQASDMQLPTDAEQWITRRTTVTQPEGGRARVPQLATQQVAIRQEALLQQLAGGAFGAGVGVPNAVTNAMTDGDDLLAVLAGATGLGHVEDNVAGIPNKSRNPKPKLKAPTAVEGGELILGD